MSKDKRPPAGPPKRRSAEALHAFRRGRRVEPSAKAYKRTPKHRKPHGDRGAFDVSGRLRVAVR